jgi:hypothetical protein
MDYGPGNPEFESSMAEARLKSAQWSAEQAMRDTLEAQARRDDPFNRIPLEGSFRLPRPILSKVLFITLPLAAIVLFLPPNGKNVNIPVGVHEFLAVMVASIGSPLLRRFAIVLLALFGVILLVGSLI